jgi:hypothetical protein
MTYMTPHPTSDLKKRTKTYQNCNGRFASSLAEFLALRFFCYQFVVNLHYKQKEGSIDITQANALGKSTKTSLNYLSSLASI